MSGSESKHYLIYKITNQINGKIYIGAHTTYNLVDRYMGSGHRLKEAIKKYGKTNFTKEIICECEDLESMYAKEADIVNIEYLKRTDVYNISVGGKYSLPLNMTIETKLKIAEVQKKRKGWKHTAEARKMISEAGKNRAWSEESRKKVSEHLKGKHHSEEAKKKMSVSKKGKTGRKLSPETLLKMSAAQKGKKKSEEWIRKIALAKTGVKTGYSPMAGKHHTAEAKAKIGNAHRGIPRTEEVKRKIGEANKKRGCSDETKKKIAATLRGRKASLETCYKISLSLKGKKRSPEQIQRYKDACKANKLIRGKS